LFITQPTLDFIDKKRYAHFEHIFFYEFVLLQVRQGEIPLCFTYSLDFSAFPCFVGGYTDHNIFLFSQGVPRVNLAQRSRRARAR
jgi:hypothetical protein